MAWLGLLCSASSASAQDSVQDYILAPEDVLQIVILEREKATGAYKIGADGMVSVPGIGDLVAAGETRRSFEAKLNALASETVVSPLIAVQILEYRPVYVLGDVREPDKQAYAPGLTVMQAVALAGGFGRAMTGESFNRNVTNLRARQAIEEGLIELAAARIRLARLRAEAADAAQFDYTPASSRYPLPPEIDKIIAGEKALFKASKQAFAKKRHQIEATLTARRQETESYQNQIASQTELLETISAELDEVRDLHQRGMVPVIRLNNLVRTRISTRGQVLQTKSLQRQAAVDERQNEQQLVALIEDRKLSLATQIQSMSETISRLEARLDGEYAILEDSDTNGGRADDVSYSFKIYRDAEPLDGTVTLNSALQPGDTLVVIRNKAYGRVN
jgi:polysaccharide export outer membrane protein